MTLGLDGEKFQKYVQKQRLENPNERIHRPEISTEEADKLAESPYVKDFNYLKDSQGVADGYTPINGDNEGDAVGGAIGGNQGNMKMPNTFIHGVRSSDLLKEFTEETNKMIEGRPITSEDNRDYRNLRNVHDRQQHRIGTAVVSSIEQSICLVRIVKRTFGK